MPALSGTLKTSNLSEVLTKIVDAKKTGCLQLRESDREGFLFIESGIILNARTGGTTALQALFQFVSWHDAAYEFKSQAVPSEVTRDLIVYDPQVLIAGVAFKEEEVAALQQAIPSIDSVPHCLEGPVLDAVEATPADRGLLLLADGHRSVREIAEMVKLSPLEVARILARFRLAGALDLVA